MYKIGFAVIHYKAIDETIECVTSICNNVQDAEKTAVVVVINDDCPAEKETIQKKIDNYSFVSTIYTGENLGYAGGANAGIKYLRSEGGCDFVVVLNNDIIFKQSTFLKKIIELYEKTNFAIAGPKIYDLEGNGNKSPLPQRDYRIWRLRVGQLAILARLLLLPFNGDLLISKILQYRHNDEKEYEDVEKKNVILQGSCLIFSPVYFEKYNGFNPNTFLYGEEDILYIRCVMRGMLTVYSPSIQIIHVGQCATGRLIPSKKKQRKMTYVNLIRSTNVLIKEIKKIGQITKNS